MSATAKRESDGTWSVWVGDEQVLEGLDVEWIANLGWCGPDWKTMTEALKETW